MIITRIGGGLGNQMFQYATARALALRNKTDLKLDIYDIIDKTPGHYLVDRDFGLGLLMAPIDFASLADFGRAVVKPNNLITRFRLRCQKELLKRNSYYEVEHLFMPDLLEVKLKNAFLLGSWQDERYFKNYRDTIMEDFAMRGTYHSEYLEPIVSSESVCLNVRRTDFVEISAERDFRIECNEQYYRQAVDVILEQHKGIRIFGFSDDVEWCEQNLKLQKKVTWVPHTEAGVKFGRYFWLMRQCKHFIIPNSSFAWWAAWLSESRDKIVVCPKQWYHDPSRQLEGLLPDDWILL
jgi:hypothetical protein